MEAEAINVDAAPAEIHHEKILNKGTNLIGHTDPQ